MHDIEPHYNWRTLYTAEDDPRSPFYGREYSEFEFSNHVYDHYIHPQWDEFGSQTLYVKQLYTDYEDGFTILEFIGEWNDCLYNDIMTLKRDLIELIMEEGITKFILVVENVLNYHSSDDCYYEEWSDDVSTEGGWVAMVNLREHVLQDMQDANIDSYLIMGGEINEIEWRTLHPRRFFEKVETQVQRRLEA